MSLTVNGLSNCNQKGLIGKNKVKASLSANQINNNYSAVTSFKGAQSLKAMVMSSIAFNGKSKKPVEHEPDWVNEANRRADEQYMSREEIEKSRDRSTGRGADEPDWVSEANRRADEQYMSREEIEKLHGSDNSDD